MAETYLARASRGFKAVTADLGEGWVDSFDLNSFDMSDPFKCVLGQAYAYDRRRQCALSVTGFSKGLDILTPQPGYEFRHRFTESHGFDHRDSKYAPLTAAWVKLITAAQQARRGQ